MSNLAYTIAQLYRDKYRSHRSPKILNDIARLKAGEPLDYIIGWSPFLGCRIDLSARPLIPRPETEFWTEQFIAQHRTSKTSNVPLRVLDVFAGSGCVGLAILKHLPNARVDFADIDARVLRGIKTSARKNKISASRYRIIRSDVLKNIDGSYNAIVANPPYIGTKKYVQSSVLKYEPHQALFGGRDGLRFIKTLITTAPQHLAPNGVLWMEYSPSQKKAVEKLFVAYHYRDVRFHKDQYGRWRFVTAQKPAV